MTDPTARYRIVADDDSARGWATALRTADSSGKKIASVMKYAFAGISVGAFSSAIKSAIEFGDEIGKASVKAGLGAREISELGAAVKQLGDVELSSLSTALKFMQVNVSKAREDNKKYGDTFRALGIDLQSFVNLAPDKQFEEIAESISKLRSAEDRARAVTEIFGKAGADLLPAFENGARGIREAREAASRMGHTMSAETVKALQEGDDAIKTLTASWGAFVRTVAVGTVKAGQGLDIIDKDRVGELRDELAGVQRQLQEVVMPADGGAFDSKLYRQLTEDAQKLERQIANLQSTYTRGGGSRRGSSNASPGYTKSTVDISATDRRLETMREFEANIKDLEERDDLLQMHLADTIKARQDLEDTLAAGISEGVGDTLKDTEDSLDQLADRMLVVKDEWSTFADQAARNMQSAFADFLFDPFEDGLDGMLKGFIDVVRRMIAEAAAAKIFESLGGSDLLGSVLGTLFGAATSSSSGSGGSDFSSWSLATGTNFVPYDGFRATLHKGEAVVPAKYNPGAGRAVSITTNIDARHATTDFVRALPEILRSNNAALKAEIASAMDRGTF